MVFGSWLAFRKNKKNFLGLLKSTQGDYKTELSQLVKELQDLEASLWIDLHQEGGNERIKEKLAHFKSYSKLGVQVLQEFNKIFKALEGKDAWKEEPSLSNLKDILKQLEAVSKLANLQIKELNAGEKDIVDILNGHKIDDHCSQMSTMLKNIETDITTFKEKLMKDWPILVMARVPIASLLLIIALFGVSAPSFAATSLLPQAEASSEPFLLAQSGQALVDDGHVLTFDSQAEGEDFILESQGLSQGNFSIIANPDFQSNGNNKAPTISQLLDNLNGIHELKNFLLSLDIPESQIDKFIEANGNDEYTLFDAMNRLAFDNNYGTNYSQYFNSWFAENFTDSQVNDNPHLVNINNLPLYKFIIVDAQGTFYGEDPTHIYGFSTQAEAESFLHDLGKHSGYNVHTNPMYSGN